MLHGTRCVSRALPLFHDMESFEFACERLTETQGRHDNPPSWLDSCAREASELRIAKWRPFRREQSIRVAFYATSLGPERIATSSRLSPDANTPRSSRRLRRRPPNRASGNNLPSIQSTIRTGAGWQTSIGEM